MHVVFAVDSTIIAAPISEWAINEGVGIVSLSHSEYEEMIVEDGLILVDDQPAQILEMTPDLRKYL